MLVGSLANRITTAQGTANTVLHFVGNTDITLELVTLLFFYVLGVAHFPLALPLAQSLLQGIHYECRYGQLTRRAIPQSRGRIHQ
ncbi:hypothetical protein AA0616_0091 [Komagataeibacter nataicola NRIC 0616]|nr:hypothetical protein AA0616_0091 [Komagataeibacter nataicola NRIC 0616]